MPNLNNLTAQDLQWGTANWSGQGYIDGLKMVWNSATSISVTSGSAFIPSLSKCLPSATTLTLSGLVLAASTWYHLYLYLNAGAPAIECVTTAPAAPYYGTARTKTGDTSRRYIGSVLTDASGNIRNFKQAMNRIFWIGNVANGLDVFRILSAGSATTATIFQGSPAMPVTAVTAELRMSNTDASILAFVMSGDYVPSGADGQLSAKSGVPMFADAACDSSQQFKYFFTTTPTGALFVDVVGYTYER